MMKMFNLKSKKAAKGFTLIEILLVVGFIALAGLGVYVVYNKVSAGGAANAEARNLDTLRAGTKTLYGGASTYGTVGTPINPILNDARVTPDSMRVVPYKQGEATITNSFGGTVTVAPVTLGNGAPGNGFRITYNNVPGSVCSKLVTSAGTSFDSLGVGTPGNVKLFGTGNLNIAALTSGCAADTGNGVTVTFDSL